MSTILIILIALAIILLSIFAAALYYLKTDSYYIVKFLTDNPNRSSIYFLRNDFPILALRHDNPMPLASTVKIILLIEYANQVVNGKIQVSEKIDLIELNKFYIPNTDGGAYNAWLKTIRKNNMIENNSIFLHEIVRGMIQFSSNANTEYLMYKLGIGNINSVVNRLVIQTHTEIYPFVSSLLVCLELKEKTRNFSDSEYYKKATEYHEKLWTNNIQLNDFNLKKIPLEIQRIWSDKLPASTAKDYAILMNKINSGNIFDAAEQTVIKEILEWPLQAPGFKNFFTSYGVKGGSTAFVLTEALYTTDIHGNRNALAIFFNDLAGWERLLLTGHLTKFEQKLFLDEKFRNEVIKRLSK